jgi:hypothetical protein
LPGMAAATYNHRQKGAAGALSFGSGGRAKAGGSKQ